MLQLSECFLQLERDENVRVVILTGKGKAFAAGADIGNLAASTSKSFLFDDKTAHDLEYGVRYFRKPFIAAINGLALGGGLEVAMMADILLCTESSKLGLPELNLGVMPGSGGTVRLTQAVGKSKAMEMLLTGEPINA